MCHISRGLWKGGVVVLALIKQLCHGTLSQLPAYWEGKGQNSLHLLDMCLVIICGFKAILCLLSDKMHKIASYGILNLKFLQYAKEKDLGRAVLFLGFAILMFSSNTVADCAVCFFVNVSSQEFT